MLQPTPGPSRKRKSTKSSPRPFERRAAGTETYYRLGTWCPRSFCYKDNPTPRDTAESAMLDAPADKPGKYRITKVAPEGTTIHLDFEMTGDGCAFCAYPGINIVAGQPCPYCKRVM